MLKPNGARGSKRSLSNRGGAIPRFAVAFGIVLEICAGLLCAAGAESELTPGATAGIQLSGPQLDWLGEDEWHLDLGESLPLPTDVHDAIVAPVSHGNPEQSLVVSADLFAAEWIRRRRLRVTYSDGTEHVFRLTPGSSLGLRLTVSGPVAFQSSDSGHGWALAYTELAGTNLEEFHSREFETEVLNRSLEANWRMVEGNEAGMESCLVGLRYIQHDETVRDFNYSHWSGQRMSRDWENDLVGLQIGFGDSLQLKMGSLAANIKLGAYFNSVTQSLRTQLSPPMPFESNSDHFSLGQEYDIRWRLPLKKRFSFEMGLTYLNYSDISQAGSGYLAAGDPGRLRYFGGLTSLQVHF